MLGIQRYDPSAAAPTSAATAAGGLSAGSSSEQDRLNALKEQIAARKRKRATEGTAGDERQHDHSSTKSKSASFSEGSPVASTSAVTLDGASDQASAGTSSNGAWGRDAAISGILKPQRSLYNDANSAAIADKKASDIATGKAKEKTKAKKRYLKAKLERRKAKKRAEKSTSGADSQQGDEEDGEDREEEQEKAQETPEEKRARKKAKREARRALEASGSQGGSDEAPLTATAVTGVQGKEDESTPTPAPQDDAKAKSKAQRKADKAARRTSADNDATESMVVDETEAVALEEAPVLDRKEQKRLAKIEELRLKQEKANRKAQAKAKHAGLKEKPQEGLVPTQPNVLPRFPVPAQPAAPSRSELDAMAISHELKDAIVVDQSLRMTIDAYQAKHPSTGKLSDNMRQRLSEAKIDELFAVQSSVVPLLMQSHRMYETRAPPRDICVSAPTGSGKTLSYVIPMVEILSTRVVTRLRALVVLPTRDLVLQVREVFEQFAKGTGLKIATATGQHSFSHEQSTLVDDMSFPYLGGSSKVDILIATPGRLMDHLKATPNFTLQHLRFLVIDEADRLLNQSFNDWLSTVLASIEVPPVEASEDEADQDEEQSGQVHDESGRHLVPDSVAPAFLSRSIRQARTDLDVKQLPSTQKLLFSATLTRDPAKIAALHLHRPIYLAVTEGRGGPSAGEDDAEMDTTEVLLASERHFSLPAGLKENMIVTQTALKPLVLLHLIYTLSLSSVICFTKSVESSARLVLLLQSFTDVYGKIAGKTIKVMGYSSELTPAKRKEVLEQFKNGQVQMLVCSDLIARGMDLPTVEHVVNYDVPVDMRKYVHRVGRTARAGREGQAWSLVETQEANYFKNLLKEAGRWDKVKKIKVPYKEIEHFSDSFETALDKLREA